MANNKPHSPLPVAAEQPDMSPTPKGQRLAASSPLDDVDDDDDDKSSTRQPTRYPPAPPHLTEQGLHLPAVQKDSLQKNPTASVEANGRKRSRTTTSEHSYKRLRRATPTPEVIENQLVHESTEPQPLNDSADPVNHWVTGGHWPSKYFESNMSGIVVGRSSAASGSRKRSRSTSISSSSGDKPRDLRAVPYANAHYEVALESHGTFMTSSAKPTDQAQRMCKALLATSNPVPIDTLFDDLVHAEACRNLAGENESRVIQDVSRLIVPSAEAAVLRDPTLVLMKESVNAGWLAAVPLMSPRPQPDYAVGFRRHAFTHDQMEKLLPLLGDFWFGTTNYFMGTLKMYFPFLTCEIKCGAAALEIADRQNAHSMTLAVRGVVELFRIVKREDELNGEVLAFSVSHTDQQARIDGWFPVIKGKSVEYHRYPIEVSTFASPGGKDKWTSYHFTMNLYKTWVPMHFKRICSVIDQLPADINFNVPGLVKTGSQTTGEASTQAASGDPIAASGADIEVEHDQGFAQSTTPGTSISRPPGSASKMGTDLAKK